jgi:cation diffusion facilitator CzcD-associated flavoprotein CzcO
MEQFDVVIVGAGLSGIGAACHLRALCPSRTYLILEGRNDLGGTWDLFRYPGVRSDSDMHTLGYRFKPWTAAKSIADGPSILQYLRETAADHDVDRHIRYRHLVRRAEWSTEDARWTVEAERQDTGQTITIRCRYLFMCSGYYSYRAGHTPEFPGRDRFQGLVVHPQAWPENLDYCGKRVVVIGSGATAMTLVPAMAATAGHVTMVQRSPTYVWAIPDRDAIANGLRRILPEGLAYRLIRWKNTTLQQLLYRRSRTAPAKMKRWLIGMVRRELGPDYDVETHFTPKYNPWDERLCIVPNGDLFEAIRRGRVTVVTDRIESWDQRGVRLASGRHLEADIIVTATGLELVPLGEVELRIDGAAVEIPKAWTYKGFAFSDVPNFAATFGYINASWTLRADLIAEYVCRLLNWMERTGTDQCTPRLRPDDRTMTPRPFVDNFAPGYIRRVIDRLPRQGDRPPWTNPQSYGRDRRSFRRAPVDDGVMRFTRVGQREPAQGSAPGLTGELAGVGRVEQRPEPGADRRATGRGESRNG